MKLKFKISQCFNTPQKWAYWMLGVAILVTVYFLVLDRFAPNTDDATVQAYVQNISTYDQGKVESINITDNQIVKKNDLLFTLEKSDYQYQLDKAQALLVLTQEQVAQDQEAVQEAQANLETAKANLIYENAHFQSFSALYKTGAISQDAYQKEKDLDIVANQTLIRAQKSLSQAEQTLGPSVKGVNIHILESQADLDAAKLNYAYTQVYAPSEGYVTNLQIREGSYISAGGTAMTLIDKTHLWIQGNFKENDLDKIKSGQKVLISINNYPGKIFHGKIDSIGWGVSTPDNGSGVLLPVIDKTNNWVNLAQRFPVKIYLDDSFPKDLPLRVGATAIVTVLVTNNSFINSLAFFTQWIRAMAQYLY